MLPLIKTEQLDTKGKYFASLVNAMLEAGYSDTFAVNAATKIYGSTLEVNCECKK